MARESLHERFDIRSTAFLMAVLSDLMRQRYRAAATTIGKEFIIEVRRGDLMLRDMGYFVLDEFAAIEQLGAWWLTRLPLTTGVVLEDGPTLEKTLKSYRRDMIDLDVIVGRARLSYEKLYDLLAVRLIKSRDLADFTAFDPDPRHITRDKRKTKSPIESGILALT